MLTLKANSSYLGLRRLRCSIPSYVLLVTRSWSLAILTFTIVLSLTQTCCETFLSSPGKGKSLFCLLGNVSLMSLEHRPSRCFVLPLLSEFLFHIFCKNAYRYFPLRYMNVCITHAEAGYPFPSYIERSVFHLVLSTDS